MITNGEQTRPWKEAVLSFVKLTEYTEVNYDEFQLEQPVTHQDSNQVPLITSTDLFGMIH
jgi:hypothetical protein